MDHDSQIVEVPPPASDKPSDLIHTNVAFLEQGLDLLDKAIVRSSSYQSNDSGHFAWDVSLAIRAACLGWESGLGDEYLQKAIRWSEHLLTHTDEATGVLDWRGQTRPVWSAGKRYTAGITKVGRTAGQSVHIQALADRIEVSRPHESTAVIRAIRDSGMEWVSPELSLVDDGEYYLPRYVSKHSGAFSVLVRESSEPEDFDGLEEGTFPLVQQRAAHLVHTGLIARSLLAVAVILQSKGSGDLELSDALFRAAKRALLSHDNELVLNDGYAWYCTPEDFPTKRLLLELPHNHVSDVATCFLILGAAQDSAGSFQLGRALTHTFLDELNQYAHGSIDHPWFYYPIRSSSFKGVNRSMPWEEPVVTGSPRGEDSSHATMRIRALVDWKNVAGMRAEIVSDSLLSAAAKSFDFFYSESEDGPPTVRLLPGDLPGAARSGESDSYQGAWSRLHPWNRDILRKLNSLAASNSPQRVFGATLLSAAEIVSSNVS